MVKALPQRFNPDLLARDGTRFGLVLPQKQMPRLSNILSSANNDVQISALFSRRKDHILISGTIKTRFLLDCQRCLKPMDVDVSERFELVFVDSEAAASDLPDEFDPVVLDETGQIHVVDLFEDEVMLYVPDIPKHSDTTVCTLRQTEFGELPKEVEKGKPNPFEALKDLNLH